jgi:hypothetical protein
MLTLSNTFRHKIYLYNGDRVVLSKDLIIRAKSGDVRVSRRKVTKKPFSELPKSRVLPDGSPATPLEEWHGGLPRPQIQPYLDGQSPSRCTPFRMLILKLLR